MFRIKSAKVTAPPGPVGWVQIHGFSPASPEDEKSRGRVFVVVACNNSQEGLEAITLDREITGKFREEYYNSEVGKPFDALRNALQKVASQFNNEGQDLQIIACSYVDGVVYSSAYGGGRVLIVRGSSTATILESKEEVITASGFPKEGDIIIAGTGDFFEKVSPTDLNYHLVGSNLEVAAEGLGAAVHNKEDTTKAGAVLIKFESDNGAETKIPEVSQISNNTPEEKKVILKTPSGKQFIKKTFGFVKNVAQKIPKKGIYIRPGMQDEATSQSRKMTLSIGIILLVILVVSIGFGVRQKKIKDLKNTYQGILEQATNEIDQAILQASVNPEESRQLFLDSETKLSQIRQLNVKDNKVDELEAKISDSRASILGEFLVPSELFLDLGLLSSGFNGDAISLSGGNIFVLDKTGSRVVEIEVDSKKSKVIAGPAVIENPLALASYEDNVYVLFQDGIYLVGNNKTRLIDKTWSGDAFIRAFAGNMYVLGKNEGQVYRYAGESGNSFGEQQNWLSSSTQANFSSALDWSINGSIYVLYPNSKILKYSLGSPQNFSIKGVIPEIGSIDAFYADPDNQNIYLLDKAGKRVVVIDKDGNYIGQYIDEQIANASKLVVSEEQRKIILLTGDKLLSIELKNL